MTQAGRPGRARAGNGTPVTSLPRGRTLRAAARRAPAARDEFGPRYLLGEPVGRGGMSEVMRAFDRARGEHVALKVLSASTSAARLGTEFRYIASLNHPGVVAVHDFGLAAHGRPFFTMELLEGGHLNELAERSPLATTVRAVREVFRTLEFVHARGIVHGDLKPSNVLMGVACDGRPYPKLLDFGVSWSEEARQSGGTPQYMAPEIILRIDRDHRCDLYSMGVVIYELLTGQHPFRADSASRVLQQHLSTPAPDPRQLRPDLPGELCEIVLALLEKTPADRFADARRVTAALDACLRRLDRAGLGRTPPQVTAPEVAVAGGSRFVGHQPALSHLVTRAKQLVGRFPAAEPALFLVSGESGSGKTRLLKELRVQAQLAGIDFLRVDVGGCLAPGEPIDLLAATISAAGLRRPAEHAGPLAAEPVDEAILAAERLAGIALELWSARPTVLAIEGIGELPEPAAPAIRAFVAAVVAGPAMVIATARDHDGGAAPSLRGIDGCEHIELRRVTRTACGELVRSLLGEIAGAGAVVDHVHRESGGNPGAVERVVQALVASDAIVRRANEWVVAEELGGKLPVFGAEAELRQVAGAVLGRLARQELEAARAAAAIGDVFDVELYEALIGGDAKLLVKALVRAQIIEPAEAPASVEWRSFRFAQRAIASLLREGTAPEVARRHGEAIVACLRRRREAGQPYPAEVLARHLAALGDMAEAAEVIAATLRECESPGAEAVALLRRVLGEPLSASGIDGRRWCELGDLLADADRRQGRDDLAVAGYRLILERAGHDQAELSASARRKCGELLAGQGNPEGERVLRQALDEARALGAPDLIGRAAYVLADRLVLAGNHAEAEPLLAEALAVAEQSGDRPLRARALKLRATLHWLRGRSRAAERDARAAVAEYDHIGSRQGMAVSRGALANALYARGRLEEARALYQDALDHAREAGWLTGMAKLENSLAAVAYHVDDWDGAHEHWRAAMAIHARTGNRVGMVTSLYSMGFVHAKRGEREQAVELYQRAIALARAARFPKGEADALGNLGELMLLQGDHAGASDLLGEAVAVARSIGATQPRIESERRLLELDLCRGRHPAEVAAAAEELRARADSASLRHEVHHLERVAGVACARAGDGERAALLLDAARAGFDRLGSRYESACAERVRCGLAAEGLVAAGDVDERLRSACKVFRRLRAQPELEAARAIRRQLGLGLTHPSNPSQPVIERGGRAGSCSESGGRAETLRAAGTTDRELALLIDLSRQLGGVVDVHELVERVVDAAIAASGAERGFVIVCDEAGEPSFRVSRGLGGVELDADDIEVSKSTVTRVLASRGRVVWRRATSKTSEVVSESVQRLGLEAIVCVPLVTRQQLLGVLYLDARQPGLLGAPSRVAHIEAFAAQAAVALQNARLFEQQARKSEMLAAAVNELRHPLDAIMRYLDVAEDPTVTPASDDDFAALQDQARRMSGMVERLVELAMTEPAKAGSRMVSVQAKDLVDAAALRIRPLADIDRVALVLDVPSGLPTILGHREQLVQALAAMLAEAVRACCDGVVLLEASAAVPAGGAPGRDPLLPLRQYALSGEEALRLAVCCRTTPRVDQAARPLALATARDIVRHHGGSWSIEQSGGTITMAAVFPSLVQQPAG